MKRRIKIDTTHGFIGESRSKAKPKPFIQGEVITKYFLDRDRVFWVLYPYLREELIERHKK